MSSEDIQASEKMPTGINLDKESGIVQHTRTDEFGKLLVPTPTNDRLDPLNWSNVQKYTIVSVVCFSYFMLTYFTTAPVPSFTLLQVQFDATYSQVNWTFAIPALGLAAGPLFCSALADIYGRRVVMIVGTTVALISSGCTSIHGISFGGYLAARFFQGFGIGPAANVGLSIINDISWEHERGFRIGLWAMSANMGTLVGGLGELHLMKRVLQKLMTSSGRFPRYCRSVLDRLPCDDAVRCTLVPRAVLIARDTLPSQSCCLLRAVCFSKRY